MPRRIAQSEVDHYLHHGYVVIERFLSADEVARTRAEVERFYPTGAQYAADPEKHKNVPTSIGSPSAPLASPLLNSLYVHPEILSFVKRGLQADDPFLVQTGLNGKYRHTSEDQDLHVDYPNNELGYPSRKPRYSQISMMLYHHDVTLDNTPTHLVSQEHTREMFLHPNAWNRSARPDLYAKEIPAVCPAGSILAWNMRTVHRGSAMRDPAGCRVHSAIVYAPASCRWLGMTGFAEHGHTEHMTRMLLDATPDGRAAIGFPPPGHDYWDEETLAGVAARYPGMDMTPYRTAMPARGAAKAPARAP